MQAPEPGVGEILISVGAAGVNRADIMQREGNYPPPPGASSVLGLEAAGEVVAVGRDVGGWAIGDPAMALLAGGGYAERVAVPGVHALPLPAGWSFVNGAATMEVFLTAWEGLHRLARLRAGETLVVHAAGSGVGNAAIQIARALGASVIATARSRAKLDMAVTLGATPLVVDDATGFSDPIRDLTSGRGADVILDLVGAAYLPQNVLALNRFGRIVLVGLVAGRRADLDMSQLMTRQGSILGMTIRPRTADEKAALIADFGAWGLPRLASGELSPLVSATYPLERAADAHRMLEGNTVVGKLVLTVDGSATLTSTDSPPTSGGISP